MFILVKVFLWIPDTAQAGIVKMHIPTIIITLENERYGLVQYQAI